jgi:hypothetical protein
MILVKFGILDYRLALFVAIFAVLVDLDHFIKFAFRKKDYSLKDAWNAATTKHYQERTFIHHSVGFAIFSLVIVVLYFINKNVFLVVGLGYYTHIFLDYGHLNILKIKGTRTIKEMGFIERIGKFELMFDIFLIIGIALLMI